jgi:uncharacterized membrane protein
MASESTQDNESCETNISDVERWISLAAGGVLAAYGLSRRSPGGIALALVESPLLYRGVMKHCPMYGEWASTRQERLRRARTGVCTGHSSEARHCGATGCYDQRPREEVYSFWRNFENLPPVHEPLGGSASTR